MQNTSIRRIKPQIIKDGCKYRAKKIRIAHFHVLILRLIFYFIFCINRKIHADMDMQGMEEKQLRKKWQNMVHRYKVRYLLKSQSASSVLQWTF